MSDAVRFGRKLWTHDPETGGYIPLTWGAANDRDWTLRFICMRAIGQQKAATVDDLARLFALRETVGGGEDQVQLSIEQIGELKRLVMETHPVELAGPACHLLDHPHRDPLGEMEARNA